MSKNDLSSQELLSGNEAVAAANQVEVNRPALGENGVLIDPAIIDPDSLPNRRSFNVAMLGALSRHLPFEKSAWLDAIQSNLFEKVFDVNVQAFEMGREAAKNS